MHDIDAPNFIAEKTIAYAAAYLDGRNNAAELGRSAKAMQIELMMGHEDPRARTVLDSTRLLVVAMLGTAGAAGEIRQDRWQLVMGSLVELVRYEAAMLRAGRTGNPVALGVQR